MKISLIDKKNLGLATDTVQVENFTELAKIISKSNWSPSTYRDGRRSLANFEETSLIGLDIDAGCSLDEAKGLFKDYAHLIMTTKSHQKEKNGVIADRFRVILRLDYPIYDGDTFRATWDTLKKAYPFLDEACKDASRFFYPSPQVVSVKDDGHSVSQVKAKPREKKEQVVVTTGEKGTLWKSTLDFLQFGAPAGTRHGRLVSAVGNMREQGYDQAEVTDMIEEMTAKSTADWTQVGLNSQDIRTIERMFNRPLKYDYKPKEVEEEQVDSFVSAADLLDEAVEYLQDKDKVKGEPTGIDGLDHMLGGGFRTGELTVLMAQAKTGKNTFYHALMHKMLSRGVSFGYASRELTPSSEVIPNLLSIEMGINVWNAEMTEEFKERAREALSKWELYFAPGYGYFPLEAMEKWFREMKDIGVNHFLFDHFHYGLMTEDYDQVAGTIKKLKAITKELDIHLNLIVQPRSLREGEKLSLATLRGGAAIGQALDNLLILERVRGHDNVSRLSLEVARHKLARLNEIYLIYDPETTQFVEGEKRQLEAMEEEDTSSDFARGSRRGFGEQPLPLPRLRN